MMPMRIRRKGRPIEKLENPTALQRRGRSFPRDHAIQFTLASTPGRLTHAILSDVDPYPTSPDDGLQGRQPAVS
jgi:hypothetical protein